VWHELAGVFHAVQSIAVQLQHGQLPGDVHWETAHKGRLLGVRLRKVPWWNPRTVAKESQRLAGSSQICLRWEMSGLGRR